MRSVYCVFEIVRDEDGGNQYVLDRIYEDQDAAEAWKKELKERNPDLRFTCHMHRVY